MSSIPEFIADREFLFRGVHRSHWHPVQLRPTSATFKTSTGCSVDRDAQGVEQFERTEMECIEALVSRLNSKGVVKISAGKCREIGAYPKYEPNLPDNPYHSHIQENQDRVRIKSRTAEKLLRLSTLVYEDHTQ